jgi:hypothetical protein
MENEIINTGNGLGSETYNLIVEDLDVAESRKVLIPSTSGENLIEADNYQAVWNLSKNSLGCIASRDYKIINHREVVKSLFEAINGLNIKFDYNLRTQGHRIFLDVAFPDTKLLVKAKGLVKGEEFIGGIRLVNSYDKTTGLLILPRLCRVVCSNGMIMDNYITGYSIRHNQKLVESFSELIEKALVNMVNSCDTLKAVINECIEDSTEWQYVKIILKNLIHYKKHFLKILENLKEKHSEGAKLTRWDIYNSVTQYCSHNTQLKPTIEALLQKKAQKLLATKLEVLAVEEQEPEAPVLEVK